MTQLHFLSITEASIYISFLDVRLFGAVRVCLSVHLVPASTVNISEGAGKNIVSQTRCQLLSLVKAPQNIHLRIFIITTADALCVHA